ncbi:hypothetical protein OG713_34800 [Streptomyces sp. NBC_00723]|uniref:hypothetical protein n=1 Tax=Streptomyces sp. NBC_00723 TaxID=2903673 RepID=UPI00386B6ADD
MAGRTWEPTKKGIRDLNRWLSKGKTVYTVSAMATNLGRYEDSHTYSAYTFDRQSRITGEWMTGHLSVSGLMGQYGAVYEKPPAGMRDIATPGRQVAGPLPRGYRGVLDEAELRGLEKQVRDSSDPKKRRWGR